MEVAKKMEVGSIAQAVELHLTLFERPLHPELFRHHADYRIRQARYQADIWIIGLSHVITVSAGKGTLVELIGPDNELLPTRGVLTRFRLKGERDLERRVPDVLNYMVSTQVEIMDEPLYKSVHNDLERHADKRGWFHPYPQLAEGELVPFTYMDHDARDGEFQIHVFHAFPHERTLIKSQSLFELAC